MCTTKVVLEPGDIVTEGASGQASLTQQEPSSRQGYCGLAMRHVGRGLLGPRIDSQAIPQVTIDVDWQSYRSEMGGKSGIAGMHWVKVEEHWHIQDGKFVLCLVLVSAICPLPCTLTDAPSSCKSNQHERIILYKQSSKHSVLDPE